MGGLQLSSPRPCPWRGRDALDLRLERTRLDRPMRQRRKRSEQAAGETLFLARAPARRDAEADTYARVRTRVTARRTRPHAAHVGTPARRCGYWVHYIRTHINKSWVSDLRPLCLSALAVAREAEREGERRRGRRPDGRPNRGCSCNRRS